MRLEKRRGLTLIEILIILGIVAVITLFAFQNIPTARDKSEKKACIGNLWMIKMSKNQWAIDERKITGTEVVWSNVVPNYLSARPECPMTKSSNSYTLNVVGVKPSCEKETDFDHKL